MHSHFSLSLVIFRVDEVEDLGAVHNTGLVQVVGEAPVAGQHLVGHQ